jgi:hypothetical protein
MLTKWEGRPRHWTPAQGHATGDVLLSCLSEGWEVEWPIRTETGGGADCSRTTVYHLTLKLADQTLELPVIDGPAVRAVVQEVEQRQRPAKRAHSTVG